ncbi:MAG: hypothetical protein Q7S99_05410 [Parvibaculum sp.]|nr:hypothetical protein [Parvibaculum sp.]
MSKKSQKGRLSLPNAAAKVENAAGESAAPVTIQAEGADLGALVSAALSAMTGDDMSGASDGSTPSHIDAYGRLVEECAEHFGITADELRARVEAGPVEEVEPDDLDLDGVAKADTIAGVPDKVYAAIVKPENDPQDDFAERLTLAYVAARKKGFGPASMTVSVATERPYITAALDAVMTPRTP